MSNIETPRLFLRKFKPKDLEDLTPIFADPEVMRYIRDGKPADREQTEKSLNVIMKHWRIFGFGLWAVVHKADKKLIGFCGLMRLDGTEEVEVGYRFAKSHWGMGLATESAQASLHYGFEALRLDRITAVTHPENAASQHVLEKIGLKYEKDAFYYGSNVKYFAISRAEYEARKA